MSPRQNTGEVIRSRPADAVTVTATNGGGCWGFTIPVTKTIRLSEWVTPGDTAISGMTSLKDGDLQHSSALAQSPKEI